jgi:hypothetical protein
MTGSALRKAKGKIEQFEAFIKKEFPFTGFPA